MIGILYIALCTLCGAALCRLLFNKLGQPAQMAGLPAFLVELPAWYLTGTLTVTWLVCLVSDGNPNGYLAGVPVCVFISEYKQTTAVWKSCGMVFSNCIFSCSNTILLPATFLLVYNR